MQTKEQTYRDAVMQLVKTSEAALAAGKDVPREIAHLIGTLIAIGQQDSMRLVCEGQFQLGSTIASIVQTNACLLVRIEELEAKINGLLASAQ